MIRINENLRRHSPLAVLLQKSTYMMSKLTGVHHALFLLSSAVALTSVQGLAASRECQRRTFLLHNAGIVFGSVLLPSAVNATPVQADDDAQKQQQLPQPNRGGKPYAPLDALLPAARLKLWVDEAYALSTSLAGTNDKDEQYKLLQQMNDVLSSTPKLFPSGSKVPKRTSRPTAQLSTGISSANKEQYKSIRTDLSVPDKMAAMLNQADVERQWGMLQYAESKREQSNDMRAAFNYYTQSLTFGDTYQLTASKEDKKRMIRNDKLPTLTAVIVSDLDLRDLYRNQFLTAIEDATAEVAYQVKQTPDGIDRADAVALVDDAYVACKKWFDLIARADVEEAMEAIRSDSQK